MASSSSNRSCTQCHDSSSDRFSNGWKFRSGEYAQLCNRCFFFYNLGQFCEAFHSHEDGWRDCASCGKLVHCGCIVSLDDYSLLETHGIICIDCSRTKSISLIPLFEKKLTASDSDTKLGRIIIPKKHAEAYFPNLFDSQVIPMNVMDTEGNEWNLYLRCWPYRNSKMYLLQGIRDFMNLNNLQAGDTVAFYAKESDGKIVMEVKKNH